MTLLKLVHCIISGLSTVLGIYEFLEIFALRSDLFHSI